MEIMIEPWRKLVIHEVIEYTFEDFMKILIAQSRVAAAGTPAINWTNGIIFSFGAFPDTDSVVREKLQGTIHWSTVMFAIKEKYESQYPQETNNVNLINASHNQVFVQLAEVLKQQTRFVNAAEA